MYQPKVSPRNEPTQDKCPSSVRAQWHDRFGHANAASHSGPSQHHASVSKVHNFDTLLDLSIQIVNGICIFKKIILIEDASSYTPNNLTLDQANKCNTGQSNSIWNQVSKCLDNPLKLLLPSVGLVAARTTYNPNVVIRVSGQGSKIVAGAAISVRRVIISAI